jgi:hypothetical protein
VVFAGAALARILGRGGYSKLFGQDTAVDILGVAKPVDIPGGVALSGALILARIRPLIFWGWQILATRNSGGGVRYSNKCSIKGVRTSVRNKCSTAFLSQSVRISNRILEIFNRIRRFFNRILTEFLLIFQPNLGLVCCLVLRYKIGEQQLVGYKGHQD